MGKRNKTAADFPISGVGENGRNLCRVCKTEVPKGRRTLCSQKCVETISMQTSSGYARDKVEKRDKGVCAICGLDTLKLRRVIEKLALREYWKIHGKQIGRFYNERGISYQACKNPKGILKSLLEKYSWVDYMKHFWEMDHIVPVCEGGHLEMDNLRTLCLLCHKRETKILMSRRRNENRS